MRPAAGVNESKVGPMLSTSILDNVANGFTRMARIKAGKNDFRTETPKRLLHSTRQNCQKESRVSSDDEHNQQGTERKGREQIKGARHTADNQLKKAANFGNQQQRKEEAGEQYGVRERRRNYQVGQCRQKRQSRNNRKWRPQKYQALPLSCLHGRSLAA